MKKRKSYTEKEKKDVISDFRGGLSIRELGIKYNTCYGSMKAFISYQRMNNKVIGEIPFAKLLYGVCSDLPDFSTHLKITSDNIMLWGDSHLPLIHEEFTARMLEMTVAFKTKILIIAGDFFDQACFSHFPTAFSEEMIPWEDEQRRAAIFLNTLEKVFDKIYIISGNHDIRLLRILKGQKKFKSLFLPLMKDKSKFVISSYPKIELNNKWLIFHPKAYSQTSMNVTRKLCTIHKKHCVTAHGHFSGLAFDVSDSYYAIDVGGILDRKKVAYIHRSITTHPKWNKGFLIIKNNYPYLFTKDMDWKLWKEMAKNIK